MEEVRQTASLFWLFVIAVGFSLSGYLVHRVARSSISNGAWDALPEQKKRIIGASGIIASILAGLSTIYVIPAPESLDGFIRAICAVLIAQILAAWGGSEFIRRWQKGRDTGG